MGKIKRMNERLKRPVDNGIFHDSRGDVRIIAEFINKVVEKQNEIIDAVNELIEREDQP